MPSRWVFLLAPVVGVLAAVLIAVVTIDGATLDEAPQATPAEPRFVILTVDQTRMPFPPDDRIGVEVVATPVDLVRLSSDERYLGAVLERADFESLSIADRKVLMRRNFALVVLDTEWADVSIMLRSREAPYRAPYGLGNRPYAAVRTLFGNACGLMRGEGTTPQAALYSRLLHSFSSWATPCPR